MYKGCFAYEHKLKFSSVFSQQKIYSDNMANAEKQWSTSKRKFCLYKYFIALNDLVVSIAVVD